MTGVTFRTAVSRRLVGGTFRTRLLLTPQGGRRNGQRWISVVARHPPPGSRPFFCEAKRGTVLAAAPSSRVQWPRRAAAQTLIQRSPPSKRARHTSGKGRISRGASAEGSRQGIQFPVPRHLERRTEHFAARASVCTEYAGRCIRLLTATRARDDTAHLSLVSTLRVGWSLGWGSCSS